MNKKQFEAIANGLLVHFPELCSKDGLLYARPVDHVLQGFHFDDSSFDRARFTVFAFCLPLYVPTTNVHFLFGDRLKDKQGCDFWWDANAPDLDASLFAHIAEQGMPILASAGNPARLIDAASRLPHAQEVRKWEVIAYSAILINDHDRALMAFDRLADAIDPSIAWQVEISDRAKRLEQMVRQDMDEAKQLLNDWEQFTARNLGL